MSNSIEEIIRDRIITRSGKDFQQLVWDILICIYPDFTTPRMQNDLGNDGHSTSKKCFFAVYAPESLKYDNNKTSKKISNPTPSNSEELGDYDKFLKNWKDTNSFNKWIFVTKDNLMGRPLKTIVELNENRDGIIKEHWGLEKLVNLSVNLEKKDQIRIFKLPDLNNCSQPTEVETIMDLICYMSDNAELLPDGFKNIMPDPDKKLERFADYCIQIKNEIINSAMYVVAQKEAEKVVGLDKIRVEKKVIFLKQISRRFLRENNNDPIVSLDKLTDYLEDKLKKANKNFDHSAIRYYLITEIPKCNVFPNENE